jgi:hypothetical protein
MRAFQPNLKKNQDKKKPEISSAKLISVSMERRPNKF